MGNFSKITEGCEGKIIYDKSIKKLKCEECGTVIEKQLEKGTCRKFNPNPIIPAGEFPPFRKEVKEWLILNRRQQQFLNG
jgi:hypothetical protein